MSIVAFTFSRRASLTGRTLTPEIAKRLALAYPGLSITRKGVADVAGVADVSRYAPKPLQIRPLRPLRLKAADFENAAWEGVAADVADPADPNLDAIEERAALAADRVPACYLDAWARFDRVRPPYATQEAWRRAVDDGGRFLDTWGEEAAALGWRVPELFDLPTEEKSGGLIWFLEGERIDALSGGSARTSGGRVFRRASREQGPPKIIRDPQRNRPRGPGGQKFAGL